MCPFTSEWLNKKHHNKKRVPIFFPFNEQFIPKKEKKKYDVIYTGHIVSGTIMNYINIISKFKYRFISNSDHKLVTNRGASYEDKMKFISQSKMTIVSNLLYPKAYHIFNIWRIADFYKNEAFKFIPGRGQIWKLLNTKNVIVPQLKSRVFEAAFGRSLILCRRDPFKVIERYFTPNEDFIYFDDDNLEEKIKEVLKDYPKYERMIDNAYKKALANYTTKKFVENYLEKM